MISAFVITKNESRNIKACLESLSFVDEVIVVDDFSEDETEEICKSFPYVFFYKNKFVDFRTQKAFAMSLTRNNWVLELDADEIVSERMKQSILQLEKKDFEKYNCFFFKRKNYFGSRWIKYGGFYPDYKGRLYNKTKGRWAPNRVHERFIAEKPWKKLKGEIIHLQDSNLELYLKKQLRYARLSAVELHEKGKRALWYHYTLRPLYTFLNKYFLRLGFLDGFYGLNLALVGARATFEKYYYLCLIS